MICVVVNWLQINSHAEQLDAMKTRFDVGDRVLVKVGGWKIIRKLTCILP